MSQSFQKCTITFNQRFFFILFCNFLRRVVVTAMFMSVYNTLMYNPFIVFFLKNEVVDVQNEVVMDICLDLTCAW